jgi:hypothetical protein
MYFVARYPHLTNGCQMKWEYFGTSHGKGIYMHVTLYFPVSIIYTSRLQRFASTFVTFLAVALKNRSIMIMSSNTLRTGGKHAGCTKTLSHPLLLFLAICNYISPSALFSWAYTVSCILR